jgi:hypothetical protein
VGVDACARLILISRFWFVDQVVTIRGIKCCIQRH